MGIVEDKASLVASLRVFFSMSGRVELVFCEDKLEALTDTCSHHTPDVVLMDVDLGYYSGLEGLQCIRQSCPNTKVLMYTVFDDDSTLFETIANGADGYILKDTPLERLENAIIETYEGGAAISPVLANRLLQAFRQQSNTRRSLSTLTPRENEILKALVKGYSYKQVAADLNISLGTVRTHIEHIYGKLGVNSKAEAVAHFLQNIQ